MKKIFLIMVVLTLIITLAACPSKTSKVRCDICDEYGAEHKVDAVTTWILCDECYYDYLKNDSYNDTYDKDNYYDNNDDGYYQKSSFKNKYGTPDTLCSHSGCSNRIASSGDTNCCSIHSNRCYECNCYIDEDANWCIECLYEAIEK